MLSLLIILVVGGSSLHFTDMESDSAFYSVFLPVLDVFCFIALALWIVFRFHKSGINQNTQSRGGGGFFGGDGGGDC